MKKIDVHAHVIPSLKYEFPTGMLFDAEHLIEVYDTVDVEKGILMPITSPEAQSQIMSNASICEVAKTYPDRFYWSCNVDPRLGGNNPYTDLSQYLMFYKNNGAVGMGELTANLFTDEPLMDNLFHHCAECGMPVTIHIAPKKGDYYGIVDDLGLPRLEKMLKKYPKLRILGHSQAFWAEISSDCTDQNRTGYPTGKVTEGRLAYLLRNYENLFCDMSAGSCCNAMTRDTDYTYRFIEEFGDRMMYAIDACAPGNPQIKGLVSFLDESYAKGCISEKNYRGICRENAIRVFDLK